MTGWDYLVLLTLGISIVLGLLRGLMRTVFALGGWLVAFVGSPVLSPPIVAATSMQAYPWVVLVSVFFVLLVLTRLAGVLLARIMSSAGLGGIDRGLGGVIGAVRALVIVAVFAVAAHLFGLHQRAAWQQAISRPLLETVVQMIEPYLPSRLAAQRRS